MAHVSRDRNLMPYRSIADDVVQVLAGDRNAATFVGCFWDLNRIFETAEL